MHDFLLWSYFIRNVNVWGKNNVTESSTVSSKWELQEVWFITKFSPYFFWLILTFYWLDFIVWTSKHSRMTFSKAKKKKRNPHFFLNYVEIKVHGKRFFTFIVFSVFRLCSLLLSVLFFSTLHIFLRHVTSGHNTLSFSWCKTQTCSSAQQQRACLGVF